MSKGNPKAANLIIEWGPRSVRVFDGSTRNIQNFDSIQAASSFVGSRPAIIAISRRMIFTRTTRVPNAAISDIRLVLSMRLGDLFPLPSSDLAYDFLLTDDVSIEGRLAIVTAMSAQDLRRIREDCKNAGVKVAQILPVALGSVLLLQSLGKTAAAVVSQDDDGIGIDIIDNKVLRYSRVATEIDSLHAEVGRTYAVSGGQTADIIVTGGLNLPDADQTVKLTCFEAILNAPEALTLNIELPETVALRAKKIRDQRQRVALLMVLTALACVAGAYTRYDKAASAVALQDAGVKKTLTQLQKRQKDTETKATALVGAQKSLDLAFKSGQRYSDLAAIISSDVPDGVWLGGLSLERGKRLVLRGVAISNEKVKAYTDKLSNESRLRNVRLEFANDGSIDLKPVVQFSISAFPNGNVPLVDLTQVKRK